jgi:hypothetical protein
MVVVCLSAGLILGVIAVNVYAALIAAPAQIQPARLWATRGAV